MGNHRSSFGVLFNCTSNPPSGLSSIIYVPILHKRRVRNREVFARRPHLKIVLVLIAPVAQQLQVTARPEKWLERWSMAARSGMYKQRRKTDNCPNMTTSQNQVSDGVPMIQRPVTRKDLRDSRCTLTFFHESLIQGTLSIVPYRRKGAWIVFLYRS